MTTKSKSKKQFQHGVSFGSGPHCQSPFHSLVEKEGCDHSASSVLGVFTIGVNVSYVEILLLISLFGKCLLYTCKLQNTELEIQETITQVKELSTFLCMGKHKSQGSLKLLPQYALELSVVL